MTSNPEESFEFHLASRWITTLSKALNKPMMVDFKTQDAVRMFGVMMTNFWNVAYPPYAKELKSISVSVR